MKKEDLYEAVTELRDDQIIEGEKRLSASRPARLRRLGALAAVLAVVVLAGVLAGPRLINGVGGKPVGLPVEPGTAADPSGAEAPTEDPDAPDLNARYTLAAPSFPLVDSYGHRDYSEGLESYLRAVLPVLLEDAEEENRVCAPLNVYAALAMLAESTAGESQQELLTLLNAPDLDTLRTRAKALWEANYSDGRDLTCLLAASLWLRDDTTYNAETVQTLARDYYASAFSGDMGDPEYSAALRRWMNEQTKGLLADKIDGLELSEDTVAALVTTVYYQAAWAQQFHGTAPGVFHSPGGDQDLDFLTRSMYDTTLYTGEGFQAAGLELSGGAGKVWFLLPDEGLTPGDLLSRENALGFLIDDEGRESTDGKRVYLTLSVPKFDVSDKTDLIEKLKSLGVTAIFDEDRSDFSPLTTDVEDPITVSKAEHGARVTADENGLTGAAYTIIEPTYSGLPKELEQAELTLDRPFLFVVANAEGLPLFIGICNSPKG